MRVEVSPRQADITPGQPVTVTVTISNTSTVIGGYVVRVLGADPGWVEFDPGQISLFPEESRQLAIAITAPLGVPAGARRMAIQIRELTPPLSSSVVELDLTVPAARAMAVRLDPLAVTAGRTAAFSVIVENTGNTVLTGRLAGDDAESKVRFAFTPERVTLSPGENAIVDLRATARRPITGSPAVRMLGLYLDETSAADFFRASSAASGIGPEPAPPAREERAALATGTFIQRALLSRGSLSLVGLLAAITVFAVVLTVALSRLVAQTTADRNLALQVAQARTATNHAGSSGVSGLVRLLTSGAPVPGVSVAVFASSDTATPIATTATSTAGTYSVGQLAAGQYKIEFRGAGFVQLWYPGAADAADATAVTLAAGQSRAGLGATLGGVPATITGTVTGAAVSPATLYLETIPPSGSAAPPVGSTGGAGTGAGTGTAPGGVPPPPNNGGAVVQTVPIGSDGTFSLSNVPSPSLYALVVVKTGYATATQRIDVGAGETRRGVSIALVQGDGLITGSVYSLAGAIGGVTVTATSGTTTATTVSLSTGKVGTFTLRNLPTPASVTIVARKAGYASQILTLSLSAGEKLKGVAITLGQSSGSISGRVTLLPGGGVASGVTVTVTNGSLVVQTETETNGDPGAWTVAGLPLPGAYTVTFARADLASQTVSVDLDASGNISSGSQGAAITTAGISVGMQSATAVVYGTVTQVDGTTTCGSGDRLGEATVSLASGSSTYTVTSASVPAGECGQYRIETVPPGTYTLTAVSGNGTSPSSQVVTLRAGDVLREDIPLARPATLAGVLTSLVTLTNATSAPLADWTVELFFAADYPTKVSQTTTTSAAGAFTFTDIAGGSYIIQVRATPSSSPVASKRVVVQPSQQLSITIQADSGG